MKVMLVGSDAGMSGAGFSMIALDKELQNLGIETVLVVRKGNTQQILQSEKRKFYVVNAQSWIESNSIIGFQKYLARAAKIILNIGPYFQMRWLIRKEKPDIVHVNAVTTYVGALAALATNTKLVWHIRELLEDDLNGRFWNQKVSIRYLKRADRVIAISQCVYNKYKRFLREDRLVQVYNGIDVDRFYHGKREILKSKKIICTIAGRITDKKGQMDVLIGLRQLLIDYDAIELWIAGVGTKNEIDKLKGFIHQECIPQSKVSFLGYVDHMEKIWQQTDIAIVASKCEAFGRVTVEAMASGCLVIGANTGGTAELITDGETGFLYAINNPTMISQIVENVICDRNQAQEIARNGQAAAIRDFSSHENAIKIAEIYKEIHK